MSKGNSRKHSSEFKVKVTLEAIKCDFTMAKTSGASALASKREVTHN